MEVYVINMKQMFTGENAESIKNLNETMDFSDLWNAFKAVNSTVEKNMANIGNFCYTNLNLRHF